MHVHVIMLFSFFADPDFIVTNQETTLVIQTTSGVDNVYRIQFNDGSEESSDQTDNNILKTFTEPGLYEVVGKATDRENNYIQTTRLVTVSIKLYTITIT